MPSSSLIPAGLTTGQRTTAADVFHPSRVVCCLGGAVARRDRPRGRVPPGRWVHQPIDLVEIGLMSAEEAKELHDLETSAAVSKQ